MLDGVWAVCQIIFRGLRHFVKCLNVFWKKTGKVSLEKAGTGDSCVDNCCFAV